MTKREYTGIFRIRQDYIGLYRTILYCRTIKDFKRKGWSKVWLSQWVSQSVTSLVLERLAPLIIPTPPSPKHWSSRVVQDWDHKIYEILIIFKRRNISINIIVQNRDGEILTTNFVTFKTRPRPQLFSLNEQLLVNFA